MNEALRKRFERQRSAAIGSSEVVRGAGQGNQAKDILRASFERHANEHREQQEQVTLREARNQRARQSVLARNEQRK
jgi:hypothetical protein